MSEELNIAELSAMTFSEIANALPRILAALKERDELREKLKTQERPMHFDEMNRLRADNASTRAELEKARAACAFWITIARQCATSRNGFDQFITMDDKLILIENGVKAGADCGQSLLDELERLRFLRLRFFKAYREAGGFLDYKIWSEREDKQSSIDARAALQEKKV